MFAILGIAIVVLIIISIFKKGGGAKGGMTPMGVYEALNFPDELTG